jgi:hypothetical protein
MRFRVGEIGKGLRDPANADGSRHHRGHVDLAFGYQPEGRCKFVRRISGPTARRNRAVTKRTKTRVSATSPSSDWHRADQQLDEELQLTFPASDALSVTRGAKVITSGPLILPSDD